MVEVEVQGRNIEGVGRVMEHNAPQLACVCLLKDNGGDTDRCKPRSEVLLSCSTPWQDNNDTGSNSKDIAYTIVQAERGIKLLRVELGCSCKGGWEMFNGSRSS
jgi:hypothetical protein